MPMVEVPGISLHLVAEGAGSPLVLLHGFPLSQIMWDAQRREFRETHRVLIPDLRGFGRSIFTDDPQPHEKVTMDQYADDVVALLDAIGVTELQELANDSVKVPPQTSPCAFWIIRPSAAASVT